MENLIIKIKDLQDRLENLKRRRIYKKDFEEEMKEIIDTIQTIAMANRLSFMDIELVLPKTLAYDWFEEEMYEEEDEAFDILKKLVQVSTRACKKMITRLEMFPNRKKPVEALKELKKEYKPTSKTELKPKEKPTKKSVSTKVKISKDPSIESEFELSQKEYVIFLLGLLAGLFLGFLLGIILE